MGTVVLVISAMLGIFFIFSLIYTIRQPNCFDKGIVRLSKMPAYIGIVCGMLFLIPSVICAFEKDSDVYASIVFLLFSFLGVVLVIAYINTEITYDDTAFTYKGFFGNTKRYDYAEITSLDVNTMEVILRIGKKKISVDFISHNHADFIFKVKKGYVRYHKKRIPPRPKEKDIFHGHIMDSDGFIFAFILITAVCIAFIGLTVYMTFVGNDESTTELRETVFVSYRYDDNDLMFIGADGFEYEVRDPDGQINVSALVNLCDSGDAVSVYCKKVNPKSGDDYYNAKAIKSGDEFILTFEDTNRTTQNANMILIPFAIGFLVIWILFGIGAVIVGRNPKKYKKLVPIFFKDGYVRY